MNIHRTTAAVLLCPLLVTMTSCITVSESNPTPPLVKPRAKEGAPAKVVVSPLTRVGIDASGDAAIFLHIDFRDNEDRSMKAFGKLRAELFQGAAPAPTPAADPSAAQPARSWDADLADPVRNALSYDEMITRTYTINLGGVPEWLFRWSRHEADAPAPTIVVQFIPTNSTDPQPLRTTYTLTR